MRFTCGNCGRVYVADDRIAGRAFRMRCKRCGHAIAVGPAPTPSTAPEVPDAGTGPAPIGDAGRSEAWEAETAFGELSREMEGAGGEPADEDVLELQTVPAPARPPEARAEPPPSTAAPAAAVTPPAPRRSRLGLGVALGVVVLAAVGGGVGYLSMPASRSAPPPLVAPTAPSSPPVAPPPAAPPAAPVQEELPPQPAIVPPAPAPANSGSGAKRAPARAPAPARTAAAPAAQTRAEPAPAAAPELRPRPDLPPRDLQQLEASLAGYAGSFDGCVADARREEPGLLASPRPVVLTMTVRPTGKVAYPTLDDAQLSRTALGACIKRETTKMVFPESGGEPVRVRMPLVLGR